MSQKDQTANTDKSGRNKPDNIFSLVATMAVLAVAIVSFFTNTGWFRTIVPLATLFLWLVTLYASYRRGRSAINLTVDIIIVVVLATALTALLLIL